MAAHAVPSTLSLDKASVDLLYFYNLVFYIKLKFTIYPFYLKKVKYNRATPISKPMNKQKVMYATFIIWSKHDSV